MDRPLTPLEIAVAHELPNNAATVSKRLNKRQPNVYRVLTRLVNLGYATKDEDKVYHWERIFPLPEMPAEFKKEDQWVKTFRLWFQQHEEEAYKTIKDLTIEELQTTMNNTDNQLSVALFIAVIKTMERQNND